MRKTKSDLSSKGQGIPRAASVTGERRAFSLIEVMVVIAILGLVMSLGLAAVQRVRRSAERAQCQNNMRQIGIALHGFHNVHNHFPSGCMAESTAFPFMSWMTQLLPFVEHKALYDSAVSAFGQAKFFEEEPHRPILGHGMPVFVCPANGELTFDLNPLIVGLTSYLGVSGRSLFAFDGVMYTQSNTSLASITDGASCTLLVGERPPSSDRLLGWWYAGWGIGKSGTGDLILGVRESTFGYGGCRTRTMYFHQGQDSICDAFHFWSRHPNGAHFLFCDGSVHFVSYAADEVLPALATRAGGETASLDGN